MRRRGTEKEWEEFIWRRKIDDSQPTEDQSGEYRVICLFEGQKIEDRDSQELSIVQRTQPLKGSNFN